MRDLKSSVKAITAILPQVASGESVAINGVTIDRLGFDSGVYACQIGNSSGSPTRFGATFQVQEKSGETDWVNVAGKSYTVSGETVSQQAKPSGEINVDFRGCGRYTRVVATPTFTSGSSPGLEIGAVLVLGDAQVEPV